MKNADTFFWLLILGAAVFLFLSLGVIILFSMRRKGGGRQPEGPPAPLKSPAVSRPLRPKNCVLPPRRGTSRQTTPSQPGTSAFWVNARSRRESRQ